jgi:hypothetical protein
LAGCACGVTEGTLDGSDVSSCIALSCGIANIPVSPLNIVGMPYYDTPLLSNFSLAEYATASSPIFHPPPKIPASILSSMRVFSGVGYAVLPKEMQGKRNVVCRESKANLLVDRRGKFVRGDVDGDGGKFAVGSGRRESGPRFRSEKSRAGKEIDAEDVSSAWIFLIASFSNHGILAGSYSNA